jgi:(2Fe-2S) ferredoxin
MKKALKARDLARRVRVNKAGCLDACEFGVSMVVYPEGVWYGRVTVADVPEIVASHLVNGTPVERLVVARAAGEAPKSAPAGPTSGVPSVG